MKIDRLLGIINLLVNNERITVGKLAETLEVSKRTIYRDINTLTAAGFPVISYSGYNGGIGVIDGFKFDKRLLSREDWEQIIVGLNAISTFAPDKNIGSLINKIAPPDIESINEHSDIIIDMTQWFDDDTQKMINDIRQAIKTHLCINIKYHTAGAMSEREVEPYKLIFKESNWYLYAYCRLKNNFRLFKINRIGHYTLTEIFEPKREIPVPNMKFQQFLPQDKKVVEQHVRLEFDLANKEFLIDKLGALNIREENGIGIIEYYTCSLENTANLVISLQDKVKVVSPQPLYDRVVSIIDNMKKVYEG